MRGRLRLPLLAALAIMSAGCSGPVTAVTGLTERPQAPTAAPSPHLETAVTESAPPELPERVSATCGTDGVARSVEIVDDVAFIAGEFTAAMSRDDTRVTRRNIAACDLRTGTVTDWYPADGANFRVLDTSVVGPWLYVAGEFTRIGGEPRQHVARLAIADGRVDTTWAPDPDDAVMLVTAASDGGMYIGGMFSTIDGQWQPALARIAADGGIDTAFEPEISYPGGPMPVVYAVAERGDGGALFVGGRYSQINDETRSSIAAVDVATGTTTLPFAPELRDTNPKDKTVEVVRIFPYEDVVYVCGDFWQIEGRGEEHAQHNVGRFDSETGTADSAFAPTTDGGVQDCALSLAADVMVIGGHYLKVNGKDHQKLAAVSLRDGALEPWLEANGTQGVWAIAMTAQGDVAIGGNFNRVGDDAAMSFAVLAQRPEP